MSNYLSRFTKRILQFIPFGGGREEIVGCTNCHNCEAKVSCKRAVKRKMEENDQEIKDDIASGNKIPEKKSGIVTITIRQKNNDENPNPNNVVSNSDVTLKIVENLGRISKLLEDITKEKASESNTSGKLENIIELRIDTPNDSRTLSTIGNASNTDKTSPDNTTKTDTSAAQKRSAPEIIAKPDNNQNNDPNPNENGHPTGIADTQVENQPTEDKNVDTTSAPSTDKTTEQSPANPDPTPVPDSEKKDKDKLEKETLEKEKLEKEKLEEDAFIKEHEVILPQTNSNDPTVLPISFSSPELTGQNLEKQIEFLRENILTPLKHQEVFTSAELIIPKGIYFHGSGITFSLTLAKALATELSKQVEKPVRLFRKIDTDLFNKYDYEPAKKFASTLFSIAVKNKPSIILIQDIDMLCNYCDHDILSNKELIKQLGAEIDKIVPGEVLVIFTVQNLKKTFPTLRTAARFQKYLEFQQNSSIKSIISNLRLCISKWRKCESLCETELDKLLQQVAEKILQTTPIFSPEDISQLCQELYQNSVQNQMKSISTTTKGPCPCKCCISTLKMEVPAFSVWKEVIESMAQLKGAASTVSKFNEPDFVPENISTNLSFASVGGLSKQIEILKENIMLPLQNKVKLTALGWNVEPVRGFIFHGPPGTGKTLLGKALAAELSQLKDGRKFSFIYHKGTDCYRMYVGQTEEKLREIFENAKKNAPAIIFMDEIDGLCSARNESGNSRFYNGVVTTMLGLMDNIPRGEVFVIAATNRLSALDPALRRPGRFDKCIEFQAPKLEGRKNILEIHTSSWSTESKLAGNFLEEIADKTAGYTGADLEQLARQAFVSGIRRHTAKNSGKNNENEEKDLTNLVILEEDWYSALQVVRSSAGNYFGNNVINDKPTPKLAMLALESRVALITKKLSFFLTEESPQKFATQTCVNTFLIWGNGAKQQKVVDNLFIPYLISGKAFTSTVAVKLDLSMTLTEMSSALHNVINPGENKLGILYIPNVDQLLDPKLFPAGVECSVKLAHKKFLDELEIVRGERVLILGTSKTKLTNMAQEVQTLFRDLTDSRTYEFKGPTEDEIRLVFDDITSKIGSKMLDEILKLLVSCEDSNSTEISGCNDVSVYDVLDFKGETKNILKKFENSGTQATQILEMELKKTIESFAKYLDGQQIEFKSALRGMYT